MMTLLYNVKGLSDSGGFYMTELSSDLVGTKIREYEILELLGKGGMGEVYRARHIFLKEERAIKVVRGRLSGNSEFIDRFIREARILIKLGHPNLVELYEFGSLEEDTFFMVMELIRGESVLQRIQRLKRIPIPDAVPIIRDVARGLHRAHQEGIVHRDISPDNIIVTRNENGPELTKLIDFGIAKPLFESSTRRVGVTAIFMGKPEYCSPEQCGLIREGEVIDGRSDIYSLGITFYYMLSGELPFYSQTPQGYLAKHITESPPTISTKFGRGQFPEKLDQFISRLLSKNRDHRPSNMEQFIYELEAAIPSERPLVISSEGASTGKLFAGRYSIQKKIGSGDSGEVLQAVDTLLGLTVAVKVMKPEISRDPRAIERLKQEVILARKVSHPNVCRVFDIGQRLDADYITMEYLEGKTLEEILRKEEKLTPDVGIPIIKQILLGLKEAHKSGIIHRDLKPQNVMVDASWGVRIMDFGFSILSGVNRNSNADNASKTMIEYSQYEAPEEMEGKECDERSDIYSVGMIMFRIFTGKLPFDGKTPVEVVQAILNSDNPKPSQIVPGFNETLEKIISKSIERDPENRYQNVSLMLLQLELLLDPTTGMLAGNREQLAHRLLAERKYNAAIRFLRAAVHSSPQEKKYKDLLQIALLRQIKREAGKVRKEIRKRNYIQAERALSKIALLQIEAGKEFAYFSKLQDRLAARKERVKEDYVDNAEDFLKEGNLEMAVQAIESAKSLSPDDPSVIHVHEMIEQSITVPAETSPDSHFDTINLRAPARDTDSEQMSRFESAWKEGIARFDAEDYEAAAALFREALLLQPDTLLEGWLAAAEQRIASVESAKQEEPLDGVVQERDQLLVSAKAVPPPPPVDAGSTILQSRNKWKWVALTLGLALLASLIFLLVPGKSRQESASIFGEVTDDSGNGLEGVRIVLQSKGNNLQIVESDSTGNFRFTGLNTGTYDLLFSRSGFQDLNQSDIVLDSGELKLQFHLSLLAKPEPSN